ncbi:hypothetical protein AAHA92_14708 [Salvia divinorum]|uniref:Uncharacterized protein n=1 Tax=Salvia divinorum TaxID=28513 RepID=A0ABD1HD63_SALDI
MLPLGFPWYPACLHLKGSLMRTKSFIFLVALGMNSGASNHVTNDLSNLNSSTEYNGGNQGNFAPGHP